MYGHPTAINEWRNSQRTKGGALVRSLAIIALVAFELGLFIVFWTGV